MISINNTCHREQTVTSPLTVAILSPSTLVLSVVSSPGVFFFLVTQFICTDFNVLTNSQARGDVVFLGSWLSR